MKIRFIESSRYRLDGSLLKAKRMFYPGITFPYLASLTPAKHDLTMTHELLEDVDFTGKADLVAMTSITNNILRTYEIADEFRRRGVPVALGGYHVTAEPEEALEHADFVFVGEAEETWPRFLHDITRGSPRKLYRADRPPSLDGLPVPDYSILNRRHYIGYTRTGLYGRWIKPLIPVQTARGCPAQCDFCDITNFHNGAYRTRPIEDVADEIRTLGARFVCFVDDNIFAVPVRAKALFRALIPLRLTWVGQGTITAAEDDELLALARRSGCVGLLVGLESILQSSLESVGKRSNKVERFARNLRTYRRAGIEIDASMVFGFDGEPRTVFDDTYEFLMRNRVPFAAFQPLRPSPGTRYYEKLKAERRLREDKWWLSRDSVADVFDIKYSGTEMDADFADDLFRTCRRYYSTGSILKRFLMPPQQRMLIKLWMTFSMRRRISRQAFLSEH